MADYEKKYYEHEGFWDSEEFKQANMDRIVKTYEMLPRDVSSLLDVGCGNGLFCNYLSEIRPDLRIVGFDRSETALKYLKTEKCEGVITKLPFPDNSIDCVTSLQVIEHLTVGDYRLALDEMLRVARRYIVISVPYMQDTEKEYTKCPSCKTIFNVDLHLRSYNENSIKNIFQQNQAKIIESSYYGKVEEYFFHDFYTKFFYRENLYSWKSPICPLCGYESWKSADNKHSVKEASCIKRLKSKVLPMITFLPKKIWPKTNKPYGIIVLFEKLKF